MPLTANYVVIRVGLAIATIDAEGKHPTPIVVDCCFHCGADGRIRLRRTGAIIYLHVNHTIRITRHSLKAPEVVDSVQLAQLGRTSEVNEW